MRVLLPFTCLLLIIFAMFVIVVSAYRGDDHGNVGSARGKQSEVDGLQHELVKKMQDLEEEYAQKKVPLIQARNQLLSSVPGFWRRAITNHPNFGQIAYGEDAEMLQALSNIEIEDLHGKDAKLPDGTDVALPEQFNHGRSSASPKYVIKLTFDNNKFFSDRVLWRLIDAYNHDVSQARTSGVTWLADQRPQTTASFFQFFEKPNHHSQDGSSGHLINAHRVLDIAHLLRYEILANPFTYYDIPTYADIAAEEARRREELVRNRDEEDLSAQYAQQDQADNEAAQKQQQEEGKEGL